MDSKWSTADVRLFKDVGGQGKNVQFKEPIKTLKPKFLVKKANTLQENCSFSEINFQEFLLTD